MGEPEEDESAKGKVLEFVKRKPSLTAMRFLLLLATVAAVWAATANAAAVAEKAEKDKNDRSVEEKEEKATCETECQKVFGDDKKVGITVRDLTCVNMHLHHVFASRGNHKRLPSVISNL